MFSQKVSDILVAPLILVLFYTGIMKITDTALFAGQLREAPWHFLVVISDWFSYALPIVELLAVLLLVTPKLRIYGFLISGLLFTAFSIYLGYFIVKGIDLPCSCGGIIAKLNWGQHLVLNLILLVVSIWGGYIEKRKGSTILTKPSPAL